MHPSDTFVLVNVFLIILNIALNLKFTTNEITNTINATIEYFFYQQVYATILTLLIVAYDL